MSSPSAPPRDPTTSTSPSPAPSTTTSTSSSASTSPTPSPPGNSRSMETSHAIRNNSLDDLRALSALQQQAKRHVARQHLTFHPTTHLHPHIHTSQQRIVYHEREDEDDSSSMRRARSAMDISTLTPHRTRPSSTLLSTLPNTNHYTTYHGNTAMHLAIVTEKLREMQWEVSRLNRKFRDQEQDNEQWFVRYSRRLVIISNIALGCWIFLLRFLRTVRKRERATGWVARLFIPPATTISTKTSTSTDETIPLSVVLISGFLEGCQSSALFFSSAVLHLRSQAWKRNIGFLWSTVYSIYLAVRTGLRPRAALYLNMILNILYVIARYYYLHGLLVFNTMRIL